MPCDIFSNIYYLILDLFYFTSKCTTLKFDKIICVSQHKGHISYKFS